MNKLNVMIVDDSALFRKFLSDIVEKTGTATVDAVAADGNECMNILKQKTPHVVLLDINMPGINGLEVLRQIKEKYENIEVIIISSADNTGKALTVKALEMGALDFISKPKGGNWEKNFSSISSYLKVLFNYIIINKFYRTPAVDRPARVQMKETVAAKEPVIIDKKEKRESEETLKVIKPTAKYSTDLILIASSTGGPKALYEICGKLPSNLNIPILIVQHMPVEFTSIFANSLNNISKINVSEAKDGEIAKPGHIYIAKGGKHMVLTKGPSDAMIINLVDGPNVNGVKPAADVLFGSVADNFPNLNVLAIVLTGMGKDGTDGLKKLKEKTKCYVITQSERTCAVYGMPKSVYEANLSDEVLDIQDVVSGIIRKVTEN